FYNKQSRKRLAMAISSSRSLPDPIDGEEEAKTLGEKLAESARQYYLIIIYLLISIVAFVAAALYCQLLLNTPAPSIRPDLPPGSSQTDFYLVISIINLLVAVFATYFPLVVAAWLGLKFAGRANALMRA